MISISPPFPHSCQEVLLDSMTLGPNIAKNAALRENVFMMAICIELRIPLFLVGKPGSSKSLAKSIVQSSMQGTASNSELLRGFKQASKMISVHMLERIHGTLTLHTSCATREDGNGTRANLGMRITFSNVSPSHLATHCNQFTVLPLLACTGTAVDVQRCPLILLLPGI